MSPEILACITGEPGEVPAHEDLAVLAERLRARTGRLAASRNLARPHPEIRKLLERDEEIRRRRVINRSYFLKPQFDDRFERRRLRILNAIFIGIARLDGSSRLRGDHAREISVRVSECTVTFDLDRQEPTRGRGASTGKSSSRLCLALKDVQAPDGVRTSWQDEDGARLESQLTEVVVGIAVVAEHIRQQLALQMAASERKRLEEGKSAGWKGKKKTRCKGYPRHRKAQGLKRCGPTPHYGMKPN